MMVTRPLRVLHVVANRWWTGSADPALDLARALRDRGHQVTFACIRGDVLEARARAVGLAPVDGLTLARTVRPWVLARDVAALRGLARAGLDVVHAHQSHDHWLAALAVRGTGTGLVRTIHHRRAVHGGGAARWLFARTDAVVAVSEGIAAAVRASRLAVPDLVVVAGAVDSGRFRPGLDGSAIRAELGLGRAPAVGCLARLVPGRGHDLLLRAMALVHARRAEVRLVLVGRGEGRPAIEGLVGGLGLERTVVFAGYRGADLPEVLAALDGLVLLGAGSEESCRAALEAMACGLPVIGARTGALPETIADGETGWLVDATPEAVARAIQALVDDLPRARAMGAVGRRQVLARHTPERRAEAVEAVYLKVRAERKSGFRRPGPSV